MIKAGLAAVALCFIVIGSVFYTAVGVLTRAGDEWPI